MPRSIRAVLLLTFCALSARAGAFVSPASRLSMSPAIPLVPAGAVSAAPRTQAAPGAAFVPLSATPALALPDALPAARAASALEPLAPALPAPAAPSPVLTLAAPAEEAAGAPTAQAPEASPESGASAWAAVFDGASPTKGSVVAFDAQTLSSPYGLYAWLSAIPELAAPDGKLSKARLLLEAQPLLAKGSIIATKDASGITLLSAGDPSLPAVAASFAADAAVSPAVRRLAGLLAEAESRDKADPGKFYVAELLNRPQSAIAQEPIDEPVAPKLGPVEDIPLDPLRQPHEHLERLLRDSARAETADKALAVLARARREAARLLNYQDRTRFLGRLRSVGDLLSRKYVPGLLEAMQAAAADQDKAEVESAAAAALAFAEYAPSWKDRVLKARKTAADTLALLERFGSIDEKTGLPSADADPQQSSR